MTPEGQDHARASAASTASARAAPRLRRRAALFAVVVAAAGGGWWAGQSTVAATAPLQPRPDRRSVVVTVAEVSVGRTLEVNATVSRPYTLVASNMLAGVVTSARSGPLAVGDEAFGVGGRSVRVVTGDTPFWRDLAGPAQGADVRQLQQALVDLGFLRTQVDGRFSAQTTAAVRAWQRANGAEPTGSLLLGEVVAVPALPATVKLGEDLVEGRVVAGGEAAVLVQSGEPRFELVLSRDQAALVPGDARVTIAFEDTVWAAKVAGQSADQDGSVALALTAPGGGPVCGGDCARLPPEEEQYLRAEIQLVEAAQGPGVPVAAVRTAADGRTYVIDADGERVDVSVRASGDGIAVLDGVDVDQRIVLFCAEDDTTASGGGVGASSGARADPVDAGC